jgi:hypothetical protein
VCHAPEQFDAELLRPYGAAVNESEPVELADANCDLATFQLEMRVLLR